MGRLRKSSYFRDGWFWQIIASAACIISMAATVTLLAVFNKKPIFEWRGVSLNALVALFSTISRLLLAYTVSECLGQGKWIWLAWGRKPADHLSVIDQASRGPLGSSKLLWHRATRSFLVFGALITVLSVAFGPMTQLVISNKVETIYSDDASVQLSYAAKYSRGNRLSLGAIQQMWADFSMQSAILNGLSQPNELITQQVNMKCPSGNCTWAPFSSLGVCSACNDLGIYVEKTFNLPADTRNYVDDLLFLPQSQTTASYAEFRLPNGLRLSNAVGALLPLKEMMTALGVANASESLTFQDRDTLIWAFSMLRVNVQKPDRKAWPDIDVDANECALWYCVQEYRSSVVNGNLSELVTSAPSQRNPKSWQVLVKESPSFTDSWKNSLEHSNLRAAAVTTDLQLGTGFNASASAVFSISSTIKKTFDSGNRVLQNRSVSSVVSSMGYGDDGAKPAYLPSIIATVYESSDWSARFATLAYSMSNAIRSNGDNDTVVIGQLGKQVVFTHVRWSYLVLPGILVLASTVFLAIVIYYTHDAGVSVWNTDLLPLLVNEAHDGDTIDGRIPLSKLEEFAVHQWVRLEANDRPMPNGSAASMKVPLRDLESVVVSTVPIPLPSKSSQKLHSYLTHTVELIEKSPVVDEDKKGDAPHSKPDPM